MRNLIKNQLGYDNRQGKEIRSRLMETHITCPQCGLVVDAQARYCHNCGVDLAIAAALAEREIKLPGGTPMTPEVLVPKIGEYLVEKGKLTTDQLDHALNFQRQTLEAGESMLLGQALLHLGIIDRDTLDVAVTEQILQLQSALQRANRELEDRVQERTRDLRNAIAKLSELNQLKANFIANISHELRTPLTQIKGYLEIMVDGGLGELKSDQLDTLQVILKAEKRLEKLIEDLIQFSLASRGELKLNLALLDFPDLIHQIVHAAIFKAKSAGIQVFTTINNELPAVLCDGEKISWVIAQMLDNAIKFTPNGGHVQINADYKDRFVSITVTDNGIGIPEEKLNDIFEVFHQLDGSTTRRYGGTGLGLALSHRILDAHGSAMVVRSQAGKGSSFSFSLPQA